MKINRYSYIKTYPIFYIIKLKGEDSIREIPLTIPNREVKSDSADDTAIAGK